MKPIFLTIKESLNKAYFKVKPSRSEIDKLKINLRALFDHINESEGEEYHKNLISDFLKKTYYSPDYFINTKDRKDLVIHNGKDPHSSVGVIIEAKSPSNKGQMPSKDDLNSKALHELILYYLRETHLKNNLQIRFLIITNTIEWFIIDSREFYRLFASNREFISDFQEFENRSLQAISTNFFYNKIASNFIEKIQDSIVVTHFNINDYKAFTAIDSHSNDNRLIELYKILSPEHLLKKPFLNDSNSLDKRFYNELLYIIGLDDTNEGAKKIITRNIESKRNPGSLIENSIRILKYEDCIAQLTRPSDYGKTSDEVLFNVAMELVITWINRILFLKLLESQIIKYHNGDKSFGFLNSELIPDYDALNRLFFQVLAVKPNERDDSIKERFGNIPYLNSSLFEPNELEHKTIRISNLEDDYTLPIFDRTVLKDTFGKKISGNLKTLRYLFEFLESFDFASEGAVSIQEENKTLINASVLGLIFEKINGYRDGSFFTPGFITMYMARETIRKAIVQKFNKEYNWHCKTILDVHNNITDKKEANKIINSLKICDPAVGSGHFLVSALNEILAIKGELRILFDRNDRLLSDYTIVVENDELNITNYNSDPFCYKPGNTESQSVQEALFYEKQIIIENCLFGVDININSVKICRLRLWIELLKHTFYKADSGFLELETLPNIDINIKCGNSLISRYPLDSDISKALRKSKWTIESYRLAVKSYRNAKSREEKHGLQSLINQIKNDFESEISQNDPRQKRLTTLKRELINLTSNQLFEYSKSDKSKWNKKVNKISSAIDKLETLLKQVKSNKIFENAFEWRFEFPDVLNDTGDFVGFDIIIGNPPYGRYLNIDVEIKKHLKQNGLYGKTGDIAEFFINLVAKGLLNTTYQFAFIIPKGLSYVTSWKEKRELLLNKLYINEAIDTSRSFQEVAYEMMIIIASNIKPKYVLGGSLTPSTLIKTEIPFESYSKEIFFFGFPKNYLSIDEKVRAESINVTKHFDCWYGKGGMTPLINLNGTGTKLLTGKEIQKYYIKTLSNQWFLDNNLLTENDFDRASKEKVVVQDIVAHINNPKPHIKLTGAIDYQNRLCLNTVMSFAKIGDYSNEFLLGLINSSLMSFYYYYFIFNQAIRTMHFMPGYADRLPLPMNDNYHNAITQLVKEVIRAKSENESVSIIAPLKEIDKLVYLSYGFTAIEIQIIEDTFK